MKTLRMMLLLFTIALPSIIRSQDVQLVKQEFFADNNLVFSGLAQDPDGNIHVCTSKDSYPENQNGVAIRNMMINGDLKDKIDLKLDMIQNIAPTAEGGFLVLFNFDMFDDAKGLRMAYSNSQEYYMSERDYGNMPGVMKISKYGSLDWVVELSYAEYFSDDDESSIIALPDNHFWIIFNYSAEDTTSEFGAQNDFTRIVLVNGNGNKLLEKDFIENEYGLLHAPVLLEDGRVLMFSDFNFSDGSRSLVWLDRQGNMTKGTLIDGLVGMSSHQIAAAGDNGFIYTGREEEKDYMALVDQSGKVIWKNPTQDIIHVLAADEHGILSLSTEKYMYAYEQTGSVLYTLTRYSFDGSVKNVMNFTTETPVDFKKMITTDYSVVLAGNLKRGDKKGVTVLVTVPAENADIFRNMNSYTYMEYSKAVEDGNTERIRTLAAFGIDPDFRPGSQGDRETETDNPLLLAFKSGKYDLAEELLKAGADPDAVDNVPVRYFIYEKPEIYNLPLTPLMYVALTPDFYDAPKYVELLHRYHADFKRITRNGTAFRQAFQMQNTAFMDLYIKYEPFTTDDLNNMFISTFENDLPSSLQWLLDHGANPNAMDFLGDTYMDKGMQSESKEIKAVLKEFGKTNKK